MCAANVEKIRELRSQAALRENVVVRAGASRQSVTSPLIFWKRLASVASIAAAVAFLTVSFGHFGKVAINSGGTSVAVKPPATHSQVKHNNQLPNKPVATKPTFDRVAEKPAVPVVPAASNTEPSKKNNNTTAAPKPRHTITNEPARIALLKDGSYAVYNRSGNVSFEKTNGSSARTPLEAKIAAEIEKKLRSGRVTVDKPVQMAMATLKTRGEDGYVAPPTAPKQVSPLSVIVMDDTPRFSWSSVDLAESYRIRILDEDGRTIVEQIVNTNSFTPRQSLERGKTYIWQVGVRFSESDNWANSSAARFAVLSSDDYNTISTVKHQMSGSHLALGVAYESLGLTEQANAEYRALVKSNPGSKLAKQLLK